MPLLRNAFALLCALTCSGGPCILRVGAKDHPVRFPSMVKSGSSHVASGRTVLPFLVSLAERPELMQPQYMRLVLGTPDNARASARPANTFIWAPADGANIRYVLSRNTGYLAGGAQESRKFVATFKQSSLRLKDVRARLGAPGRRFYDNRSHLVEVYEIAPGSTLTVSEPSNTFDVADVTVSYMGPYLPATSTQDLADAAAFRLEQIDHHLRNGSNQRGLAFLQEHIIDNPEDIGAHLILADCLKNRCDVNGAIYECRRALALAQASGDEAMQKQALKKLGSFGLVTGDVPLVKSVSLSALSGNGSRPQ